MRRGGVFALDQVLRRGNEIIKYVLLVRTRT